MDRCRLNLSAGVCADLSGLIGADLIVCELGRQIQITPLAYIFDPLQCIQDLGPWSAQTDQLITKVERFRVIGSGRKSQVTGDGRSLDGFGFDLHGGNPSALRR
jgi:hypothetical protein